MSQAELPPAEWSILTQYVQNNTNHSIRMGGIENISKSLDSKDF